MQTTAQSPSSHDVLCAGILVADHVSTPIDHLPTAGELILADRLALTLGGCAGNVAVNLTRLGADAGVCGRVGDDLFASVLDRMVKEAGVRGINLIATKGSDTSQTLIVNVKGQDRRFIHTFGANRHFVANDIPAGMARKVLYLGGYLLMEALDPAETASVLATARASKVRTVVDVVTPGPAEYMSRLKPILPHTDVFMPNDHEGQLITGHTDPVEQAKIFLDMGANTVLITMGERGSVLANAEGIYQAKTFPIDYVDGSGGGDAFAAGFILGMISDKKDLDCLIMGSAVGASCVRAIGTTAGVFTLPELTEFLQNHLLEVREL